MIEDPRPHLLVFTTLFPNAAQPGIGVFIRERMFRVGAELPLIVVAPVPWFPFQGLIRRWRPHFRPQPPYHEIQEGFQILHPRFISVPGLFKSWDGWFMAWGSFFILRKLKKTFDFNLIDAHFAYPDGYAASLLGAWFKVPVTITLRGTEIPLSRYPDRCRLMVSAMRAAGRIFSVSNSLKHHAVGLGVAEENIRVVGNGVDCHKFFPVDRASARRKFGIPEEAKVLISVGGLVPRKGFQRVIAGLPELLVNYPNLIYLIVGGSSPEGDMREELEAQVARLGLERQVRFLGALPSDQLREPLSAADLFVLATANEGWANVFLEAMACGLPVVTTDVGGNREVVCDRNLGIVVPFGDSSALLGAMRQALDRDWDRAYIVAHARENGWERRVEVLCREFRALVKRAAEARDDE